MDDTAVMEQASNVELATELTIAWISNPNTRAGADDVVSFLGRMNSELSTLVKPAETTAEAEVQPEAMVTARKSLASPDHIISMIDGKPYRTLRRHLATHDMTPEQYRSRFNLKSDYPMVAPSYSEARRAMAKKIGLGRKPGTTAPVAAPAAKPARKPAKTAA